MNKLLTLENELKINAAKIKADKCSGKELRLLLLQRSNIKDMLLEAYRAEMSLRIADDYAGDSCAF